jgi:nucleoside-diphosphate-sugar epimerase
VFDLENLYDEGLIIRNDLLKAQVKQNDAKLKLLKAENGLTLSKMVLAQIMGVESDNLAVADGVESGLEKESLPYLASSKMVDNRVEIAMLKQKVPIDEKHPKQPQSPYSATKIGADAIAMSFFNAFELPVVIARPFNTYGPRQSARAIIPTIITQIANGKKEIQVGDLTPTRDFNYVKDTCKGFVELSACDEAIGQEVNIAGNQEISMRDTLQLIAKIMDADVAFVEDKQRIRPKNSEVFRLRGDNSKIKQLTGYTPSYSLEDGLRETVKWFLDKNNLKKYKYDIYNI